MEHWRPQETRWAQPDKGVQRSWEGLYYVQWIAVGAYLKIIMSRRKKSLKLLPSISVCDIWIAS